MTLEPKDKALLSEGRMQKARKYLDDARANLAEQRYETAVNRSYYATLNAVRAILILEGSDPESHKGVVTMLSLRFIKPGLLPKDILKRFEVLLVRRTDVDYGDFETVDAADAADSVVIAGEILRSVEALRQKLTTDLS